MRQRNNPSRDRPAQARTPANTTGDIVIGLPMPVETATPSKQERETWEDWLPEGSHVPPQELITREELITTLRNLGVSITPVDLRNWQQAGVVPYGKRGWDEKTRKTRTLYPPAMVTLIQRLRKLQGEGYKLQDIGPRLRSHLFYWATVSFPFDEGSDAATGIGLETPMDDILRLKPILQDIALYHGRQIGRRVTRVDVRLKLDEPDPDNRVSDLFIDVTDESGALFTYSWP
jgi:hypothetical protein